MIDIYIVHNNPIVEEEFKNLAISSQPFVHFIDEGTLKGKSSSYKLKSEWGARKIPFACIYEDGKMKKGFYTEADNDIINSLINYLNGTGN